MRLRIPFDVDSGPPPGSAAERLALWTRLLPALRITAPAHESRAYFRCLPLLATISVEQCRANRARLSTDEALALPFEVPSWWLRPPACVNCALAQRVEAGQVPFFTAEEVHAGKARQAGGISAVASHWVC